MITTAQSLLKKDAFFDRDVHERHSDGRYGEKKLPLGLNNFLKAHFGFRNFLTIRSLIHGSKIFHSIEAQYVPGPLLWTMIEEILPVVTKNGES